MINLFGMAGILSWGQGHRSNGLICSLRHEFPGVSCSGWEPQGCKLILTNPQPGKWLCRNRNSFLATGSCNQSPPSPPTPPPLPTPTPTLIVHWRGRFYPATTPNSLIGGFREWKKSLVSFWLHVLWLGDFNRDVARKLEVLNFFTWEKAVDITLPATEK